MRIDAITGDFGSEEYVICVPEPLDVPALRDRMLQRAAVVPGSYAYHLVDELHAAIFARSLNLKADYEKYFSREYATFALYLRRRERIPTGVAAALNGEVDKSGGIFRFRRPLSFLTDDLGPRFLRTLLAPATPEHTT